MEVTPIIDGLVLKKGAWYQNVFLLATNVL